MPPIENSPGHIYHINNLISVLTIVSWIVVIVMVLNCFKRVAHGPAIWLTLATSL